MELLVFKRKTLERIENTFPGHSISDIYTNFLYELVYPDSCEIKDEEKGRWIYSGNVNIFDGFFNRKIENEESVIISEETFQKMKLWLENKLRSTTLYDFIEDESKLYEMNSYISAYKNMCSSVVDFKNEFILYSHDW